MATRSKIGIVLKNNDVLGVYHDWDGYPEWLGKKLKKHFNDYDKALALIQGGNMCCCWINRNWVGEEPSFGPLYYSEYGYDLPPERTSKIEFLNHNTEEFAYLFNNGQWEAYNTRQRPIQEIEIPD